MEGWGRGQAIVAFGLLIAVAYGGLPPDILTQPVSDSHAAPPFGPLQVGAIRDPIEVSLALSEPPRLGHSSSLQVRLSSEWSDLSEVTVKLEAPQGLWAWDTETRLGRLSLGQERTLQIPVLPWESGLKHLTIWATGLSDAFGPVGGHGALFLDVPAHGPGGIFQTLPVKSVLGGAVLTEAPASGRLQRNPERHPGPATEFRLAWPAGPEIGPSQGPASHASFNVTGQWTYFLEDTVSTAPQRWITVEVWDEDAGDDDLLWTGLTDAQGNFTSVELSRAEEPGQGNQDVYVRFVACNDAVCAQATNGTTYSWQTETVSLSAEDTLSFGTRAPDTNRFAPRPFQYINNAWDYAVNLGGLDAILGQVRVLMPDACTFYTRADDTIHLCAGGLDDRSPDDVGHEYAHYVQDKMYGDEFWPSSGGIHFACGEGQNRGLSWTEGFADFFGPRANQEIVDSQDRFYSRPWDGSLFIFDLESDQICPADVRGDDNEFRVATALWDLADDVDDGPWDVGIRHAADVLFGAITGCDQSTYRDFYDGGQCNWVDRGNPAFDFLATAFQNTIDYNLNPVAQVTSPTAFSWAEGSVLAEAEATDPDSNVTSVEFRVSSSAVCANFPLPGVKDASAPFSVTLDISLLPDGRNYWVCGRATDELEDGAWSPSPQSFGRDTTPPASTASVEGVLGAEGWYVAPVTVELRGVDVTSGIASIAYRVDAGETLTYTDPFQIQGDGIHTVAFFAMDLAGNVEDVQPLLVLIDTGPPLIQIQTPTPGAYLGQAAVTLVWSVTDAGAGVEGCAVQLDGGPTIPISGEPVHTFTNVADGAHQAAVSCADRVDRVAEVAVSFTVDTNPLSPTGPFGPTAVMGIAGLAILVVALLLRRRK